MHLDDEQLQRMLHQELGGAEWAVGEHLSSCVECRSRLSEAEEEEQWVLDRLRVLDHAAPLLSLAQVTASLPSPAVAWRRWAAGIVLFLAAAGVAYAAPGSPLPRVVERLISLLHRRDEPRAGGTTSPSVAAPQAGIAVDPGSRLTIVYRGDQPQSVAIVSLSDSREVIVSAAGGTSTFTADTDRLTIDHSGPPVTIQILIPRQAPRVEVYAGNRRIFLKQGSSIVSPASPDPPGRYRLPLTGRSP
jgi:hypothetical protein